VPPEARSVLRAAVAARWAAAPPRKGRAIGRMREDGCPREGLADYPTISLKPSPMASCTLLMITIAEASMLRTTALRASISLRDSTT